MSISGFIIDNKKVLSYIFVTALILRAISFVGLSIVFKSSNLNKDFEYGAIARSLIEGRGYSAPIPDISTKWGEPRKDTNSYRPSADQLPFYPIFLAVVYYFLDAPVSFFVVKIIQSLFSSAICMIIYLIALKLFDKRAAIIAGIISVVYPVFILNIVRIVPETFFTFWLVLSVLYLIVLKDAPSINHQLTAGVLIGITFLNSNVIMPILPFIAIYMFLLSGTWKERLKRSALVMITAFLIVSPWLVRNYLAFGEFPLMKSTMGLNLWLGNNPKATGTFFLPSGEPMEFILPEAFYKGFTLSETAQDKMLYNDVLSYIKENPGHYAGLFLKRFYYFTWFPPDNLVSKEALFYKKLFQLPYGLILTSSVIGIILFFRRNTKDAFLLCAIIFSVAALYSIFIVGHMRYRMPIEPFILLFASYGISSFLDKYVLKSEYRK